MPDLIQIDGSFGEGGGQILRTSLALSAITGRPFRIHNIRANRPKPGLRRQHMTAVLAAAKIADASVTGAEVDAREVTFVPNGVRGGDYHFDVGSAGSTMLVLQTILPALMTVADAPSTVTLEGGTHNVGAPPFPFLAKTFLPTIARMGPRAELAIERAGFAPRGGGRARASITPAILKPIEMTHRGPVGGVRAVATIAGLPRDIAERELKLAGRLLELRPDQLAVEELPADQGPGNVCTVEVESASGVEVFTAFGQRGVQAEEVGWDAARQAKHFLDHDVPVGEHLADQLLLPMALARGGVYVTDELSLHATTDIDTIGKFLDVPIATRELGRRRIEVRVGA